MWLAIGCASAFLAVAAGAFGAHALRDSLSPEFLAIFEVGARYQMYHALALVAIGAAPSPARGWRAAAWCFLLGTIVFSGSLYALALSGVRGWGAITPIGGGLFLIGWAIMAIAALRRAGRAGNAAHA